MTKIMITLFVTIYSAYALLNIFNYYSPLTACIGYFMCYIPIVESPEEIRTKNGGEK